MYLEYAYCANNPIDYYDPTGQFMISTAVLIGAIIGAVVGGAIGYGVGYLAGGKYSNGLVAKSVTKGVKAFMSQAEESLVSTTMAPTISTAETCRGCGVR